MSGKELLFVPNTSLQEEAGRYYLPRPDFDFLRNLASDGMEVAVMNFIGAKDDPFSDYALNDIEQVEICALGFHDRKTGVVSKTLFYVRGVTVALRHLLMNGKFVYIYFPGHIPMVIAVVCALTGKRFGMYVRGIWKRDGLRGALSNLVFSKASFVFTTGQSFASYVKKYNENTEPVYPMTTFSPEQVKVPDRRGRFARALFVGHIREKKGILDVVMAMRQARNKGLDLWLDVVGGGDRSDMEALNSVAEREGVSDRVTYHGHISDPDELRRYFSDADVFLYPSYYPEGYPRVVYEAMIFGLPIICTVLPGMQGFNIDQENCLEVPPRTPGAIAEALLRLENEPELRMKLGQSARNLVDEYFSGFRIKGHTDQFREKFSRKI